MIRRRGNVCVKRRKAPIVSITFGGALLCFCFISHTVLIISIGVSLVCLGIYLLKNN
jgi:uncharacterized membrane protein HdeD (DUF308 family)